MDGGDPEAIPQIRPWLGEAERDAVTAVLASGWLTEGRVAGDIRRRVERVGGGGARRVRA